MGKDTIYRQDAIDAVNNAFDRETLLMGFVRSIAVKAIRDLPSAEPDNAALHDSCTDCPLYDHDRHRCPRFNKVIPTTIQEILDTQTQRWIPVTERMPEEDGA